MFLPSPMPHCGSHKCRGSGECESPSWGFWGDQYQAGMARQTSAPHKIHTPTAPPPPSHAWPPTHTPDHATPRTPHRRTLVLQRPSAAHGRPTRVPLARPDRAQETRLSPTAPQGQTKTAGTPPSQPPIPRRGGLRGSTPETKSPNSQESKRTDHGRPSRRSRPVRRPALAASRGFLFLFPPPKKTGEFRGPKSSGGPCGDFSPPTPAPPVWLIGASGSGGMGGAAPCPSPLTSLSLLPSGTWRHRLQRPRVPPGPAATAAAPRRATPQGDAKPPPAPAPPAPVLPPQPPRHPCRTRRPRR